MSALRMTLLFTGLLALTACVPDDVTDDTSATDDTAAADDTATDDTGTGEQTLVGDWSSTGDDISELFSGAPFRYTALTATFNGDGSYTVVGEAQSGTYTFSGTYVTDTTTDPHSIVLTQTSPSAATAEGIYALEDAGDTLRYEVVQTVPDYGFVPPTPESGFGSTSGGELEAGVNVQVYRRQ